MVVAEASACGVSFIASNIGGLPEVVIDCQTGLLTPPGDVEALVNALKLLIAEPAERIRMGCAGRKHVEYNFDMRQQVNDVLNLYRI